MLRLCIGRENSFGILWVAKEVETQIKSEENEGNSSGFRLHNNIKDNFFILARGKRTPTVREYFSFDLTVYNF